MLLCIISLFICISHVFGIEDNLSYFGIEDNLSHFAYLYQTDSRLLENFRNIARRTYQTLWHDMINENYNSGLPYKIPKIIHVVWFGSPMPEINRSYIETWRTRHPDWEFCLWDEKAVAKEFKGNLENQEIFDNALLFKRYAEASDVVRYEILKRFGGLYIDSDSSCHKNFDVLHKNFDFYVGLEPFHDYVCGNAFIGSKQNHPICNLTIKDIKANYLMRITHVLKNRTFINIFNKWKKKWLSSLDQETSLKLFSVLVATGPGCLTRNIAQYFDQQEDVAIALTLIAPVNYFYTGTLPLFAQHHAHGSWYERPKKRDVSMFQTSYHNTSRKALEKISFPKKMK